MDTLTDFYPTPKNLIRKMVEGLKLSHFGAFLEPSGGKGDICDYIKEHLNDGYDRYSYRTTEPSIDVIEINPDLQHVIKGKGYRLVHDDFLTFESRKAYDCIIANFPFSEGDKHLDKALQLLEARGGELRCLVNAETLRNPHTNLRKTLVTWLRALDAKIEYLAGEFESAERKASVEVALIKVTVERPEAVSLLLASLKKAQKAHAEEFQPTGIIEQDFVKSIVAQFNMECDAGISLIKEFYAMAPFIKDSIQKPDSDERDYSKPLLKLEVEGRNTGSGINSDINNFLKGARSKYWEALVNDPRFTAQYTSNILKELSAKLTELKDYDFSVFNINEMQKDMQSKVIAGVEAAILALFDKCSRQHSYWKDEVSESENIWMYNGWKTNKAWKINKKIILPLHGIESNWSSGQKVRYGTSDELRDMVKVFNYLSRDKVNAARLVSNCISSAETNQNFTLDLRYFRIKMFKKGTCHIWFKDMDLLDKFNIFGSQRKNWLPPAYGKKTYTEMNDEERGVVDQFQGRAKYEAVMKDAAFYIVDTKTLLLEA